MPRDRGLASDAREEGRLLVLLVEGGAVVIVRFVDMDGGGAGVDYPAIAEVQVTKDHLWVVGMGQGRVCLAHYVEQDDPTTDSGNRDGWRVVYGTGEGRVFSDFLVFGGGETE